MEGYVLAALLRPFFLLLALPALWLAREALRRVIPRGALHDALFRRIW